MPKGSDDSRGKRLALEATASDNSTLAQLGMGRQTNYFNGAFHIPEMDDWSRVADVDPMILGIHRCRPVNHAAKLTPYIGRDVDRQVRESISRSQNGGFTLIVGDSTAGKTRTLYEAVAEICPDARIFSPSTSGEIRQIPQIASEGTRQCVLWLDDLERYLGPDGVDPFLVGRLIESGVCIAATMRAERYETFMPRAERAAGLIHDPLAQHVSRIGMQVLNVADLIELERVWSTRELQDARNFSDPRIVEAVDHHGPYGIAEYLAAGPPLYSEWKWALRANGNPRGHSLVAAAIDLARAGLVAPIKLSDLEGLHGLYLNQAGGAVLRPEKFEEAVEWATSVRFGVTSLLMPDGDGWRAFDYLVDAAAREDRNFPTGEPFWLMAASIARHEGEYFSATATASKNGHKDLVDRLWAERVNDGDDHAAFHLALQFEGHKDDESYENWLLMSAGAGNDQALFMLGELEIDRGDIGKAISTLSWGLELGGEDCAWRLGDIYANLGDVTKAENFGAPGMRWEALGRGSRSESILLGEVSCARRSMFSGRLRWTRGQLVLNITLLVRWKRTGL
ncbi:hypothetical protein LN042_27175 [Kitasatospora sp. RB6PN24]|uniref:tetratricopeptide repeat protein n=1 Tax=Kitasatospora humi TaxID=2893891 RepID=UPI001E4C3C88|nr:hypothetical protein [Kitasatospora humi]MCC9310709.1 hypothetical protein [Kitasatospora humi]